MEEKKLVKSKEPPRDAEEWLEYIGQVDRKTPERLEDAAKFLATMIAISLSIFTAVTKAGGVLVFNWPARIALFAWVRAPRGKFVFVFCGLMYPGGEAFLIKGISNNEQGMSNVEGKRAYKLHHSSFVIPCSSFTYSKIIFCQKMAKLYNKVTIYHHLPSHSLRVRPAAS